MIRQDYLLRMIQEMMEALSRIRALRKGLKLNEAASALDAEFQKLVSTGPEAVARMSETELLASLTREGPSQAVREKTFILTGLLAEAGDVAEAQSRGEEARGCRLKALHLLLEVLSREDGETPEFVPRLEVLLQALGDAPLPPRTLAMLMHHYERTGQLGKAEDVLFALLDSDPGNDKIVGFGREFYQRLQTKTDSQLDAGGLPRAELEQGLKDFGAKSGRI